MPGFRSAGAASFGIVERSQAVLPVTVRNVEAALPKDAVLIKAGEAVGQGGNTPTIARQGAPMNRVIVTDDSQIIDWLKRLRRADEREFKSREAPLLKGAVGVRRATLPLPGGGKQFEVIGIALPEPGFHVVELESERLGAALLESRKPMYVRAGALVTNLAVHLKLGRDASAVWVTTLDSGAPVAEAAVRLSDCNGREVWTGRTAANGTVAVRQGMPAASCGEGAPQWFVSARKGDDLSFTQSDWQKGIEPWRFNLPSSDATEINLVAHTVFDRPLFRAGETVSMKHFVRSEGMAGFTPVAVLPVGVRISQVGSDADIDMPLNFGRRGSAAARQAHGRFRRTPSWANTP